MTNRTRGRLMALIAMAAFAGAVQLVFHPFRPPPPPSPPPDLRALESARQANCAKLAHDYSAAWSTSTSCTDDAQCVVENRSPTWAGTDECHRIFNKDIAHTVADRTARQWRTTGCSSPEAVAKECPPVTAAHCRKNRCVERPAAPLPADWKRHVIPNVARLYLPADFQPVTTDVKTTPQLPIYAELEGKGRTFALQVVWRPIPARSAAPPAIAAPGSKPFPQPPITIDDYAANYYVFEGRPAQPLTYGKTTARTSARHFSAMTELGEISGSAAGLPASLEAPGRFWLVLGMTCDSRPQCEDLSIVAEQSELLLVSNSPKADDAGTPTLR